jgi:hypothetical protein
MLNLFQHLLLVFGVPSGSSFPLFLLKGNYILVRLRSLKNQDGPNPCLKNMHIAMKKNTEALTKVIAIPPIIFEVNPDSHFLTHKNPTIGVANIPYQNI